MMTRVLFWLAWHGLAALVIATAPVRFRFENLSYVDPGTRAFVIGAAVAYLAVAAGLTLKGRLLGTVRVGDVIAAIGLAVASLFVLLNLQQPVYYRTVVLASLLLICAFGVVTLVIRWAPRTAMAGLPLLAAVALVVGIPTMAQPHVEQRIISTAFYDLVAWQVRQPFTSLRVTGGGLAVFRDQYLLATGDGDLFAVRWDAETSSIDTQKLPHRVPLNWETFAARHSNERGANGTFRTADILVQDVGDGFRLFASHHFWHDREECFTVRVSSTSGSHAAFIDAAEAAPWTVVYESEPCLPFAGPEGHFGGHQIGGKLQQLDEQSLLLTLGDHERDGVMSEDIVSQQDGVAYGKTVRIDLETGTGKPFTIGHRNPQGLHIDGHGNIWSTEHGPKGGDELNLLLDGRNYGWPLVTYGTAYDRRSWPFSARLGRHDGFEEPVYAWVPSIGISALTRVRGDLFGDWKDDLLVASMGDQAIWRVRLHEHRVTSMERIRIGGRLRDMIEGPDGRLVLWTEGSLAGPTDGAVVVIEPLGGGPASSFARGTLRGQVLFAQCSGCHTVDGGAGSGLGPTLQGVVGRRIATAPDFTFSEALRETAGAWTEARLDAFLSDPSGFAPGTIMQSGGIASAEERADLIDYLKTIR